MLAEGARRVASGERVRMNDLVLTPSNIGRLTERLSHLRGAAMKMGQMLSMDAGDALPPELSDILAKLRDNADFMPPRQLDRVLAEEWGNDWRKKFRRFEPRPIAAASIGQVHRALTRDGRKSSAGLAKSSRRFLSRRLRSFGRPRLASELKSMLRKTPSSLARLASSIFSSAMLINSPMLGSFRWVWRS